MTTMEGISGLAIGSRLLDSESTSPTGESGGGGGGGDEREEDLKDRDGVMPSNGGCGASGEGSDMLSFSFFVVVVVVFC